MDGVNNGVCDCDDSDGDGDAVVFFGRLAADGEIWSR